MQYSSHPHAVTVFRAGAVVERRIQVPARTGPVVLPGLPLSLVDSSIAVQVAPGSTVRVASARVRLHARPREDAPEGPDHEALRSVGEDLARARRQRDQLQAEVELLSQIPMPQRPRPVEGQAPPPSPLQARLAFDSFVDGETRQRHDAVAELTEAIQGLEREEADLLDRVRRGQQARAARPEELSKSVHVELHGEADPHDSVELRLSYRVPGCRWVPRYALRIRGDQGVLELRAAVAQGSGEDWNGVELTLSTAVPHAYSELPSLPAARIGKAQPPPPTRPQRPPPQGTEALFDDVDRALSGLPRPPRPALRSVETLAMPPLHEAFFAPRGVRGNDDDMDTFAVDGAAGVAMEAESAVADEAPMPEPAPAAPPMARPARTRSAKGKKQAPPPLRQTLAASALSAPADLETTTGWPDYRRLHLPDPFGSGRGKLRPRDPHEQLAAAVLDAGRSLPFDVPALLRSRRRAAEQVAGLGLPSGASAVGPSHFDHAVRADRPVDIPSLGSWHTVSLAEARATCRLRYIGVPREEAAVYRIATLPNPCGHPLLQGPVEVYVDDAYVLTATLPATGSAEDVELGVGVEPAIHVARNARFEEARSDERVVAMRELHHRIAIELRNDLGHPVDVEIRERVPIPDGDAEVAVDVVSTAPPWSPYDQQERGRPLEGGHRWRVELAPRTTEILEAHYVVRLYANHEVVGGDRREA